MLGGSYVLRLHALASLGRLVGDLGALVEGLEALAGDAGVVHEEVLTPVVRGDKAVALLVAEPLHCSLGHNSAPTFRVCGPTPNKKATLGSARGGAPSAVNPPYSYVTGSSISESCRLSSRPAGAAPAGWQPEAAYGSPRRVRTNPSTSSSLLYGARPARTKPPVLSSPSLRESVEA